jgi:hypothetical protein
MLRSLEAYVRAFWAVGLRGERGGDGPAEDRGAVGVPELVRVGRLVAARPPARAHESCGGGELEPTK